MLIKMNGRVQKVSRSVGRALVALKKATEVQEKKPLEAPAAEVTKPSRRTYRRRDLTAEQVPNDPVQEAQDEPPPSSTEEPPEADTE